MKKTFYIILFFLFLLCLFGCTPKGTPVPIQSGSEEFEPRFLFEVEGVKVYRFYDGASVYFTIPSSSTQTVKTVRSGKISHSRSTFSCNLPY